jgi:hypothetical protein
MPDVVALRPSAGTRRIVDKTAEDKALPSGENISVPALSLGL